MKVIYLLGINFLSKLSIIFKIFFARKSFRYNTSVWKAKERQIKEIEVNIRWLLSSFFLLSSLYPHISVNYNMANFAGKCFSRFESLKFSWELDFTNFAN